MTRANLLLMTDQLRMQTMNEFSRDSLNLVLYFSLFLYNFFFLLTRMKAKLKKNIIFVSLERTHVTENKCLTISAQQMIGSGV